MAILNQRIDASTKYIFEIHSDSVCVNSYAFDKMAVFTSDDYTFTTLGTPGDNIEAIDLGLSVLWANKDLALGDKVLFTWSRSSLKAPAYNGKISGTNEDWATFIWGEDWRTPTWQGYDELREKRKYERWGINH